MELKQLRQRFRELLEQMGGMLQHFKPDTLAAFKASAKSIRFEQPRSYPGNSYSPTASPSSRERNRQGSPRNFGAKGSPRSYQAGASTPNVPRYGANTTRSNPYKPVTPIDNAGAALHSDFQAGAPRTLAETRTGPGTQQEIMSLQNAIRKVSTPFTLTPDMIDASVSRMYKKVLVNGEILVSQGEPLDCWYVVGDGRLECMTKPVGGFQATTQKRAKGDSVCDEGLSQPDAIVSSHCSVQALTQTWLWVLDKTDWRAICTGGSNRSTVIQRRTSFSIRQRAILEFLKTVPVFKSLTDSQYADMARGATQTQYKKGEAIVSQGDEPGPFFIIKDGRAVVRMAPESKGMRKANAGALMGKYKRQDYFGERCTLRNTKRAATVQAMTEIICIAIESSVLRRVVKENQNFKDLLYQRIQTYQAAKPPKKFQNRVRTKLEDLEDLGVLGVGSFGRVHLMKDPKSTVTPPPTYALKVVRKKRVVETGQQEHMKNERKILSKLDCPFIVRLEATYQDKTKVYFLMEAVLGGELFTVLRYNRKFSERTARFYAGCCVLAFEHMHKKDIIYRDLKPENLLLDNKGYVKLTDFGFAKVRNSTCTLCGTPEYLAPEVIRNWTQSYAVDWWGLGILIYEMLVSNPPFEDDESMKMYEKILTCPVSHAKHVSRAARGLIDGLLKKNAYQRLGSGPNGAEHIKKHAWFDDFDWNRMSMCEMRTPYVPRVRNNEDLSNFEEYPPEVDEKDYIADPNAEEYAWAKDF